MTVKSEQVTSVALPDGWILLLLFGGVKELVLDKGGGARLVPMIDEALVVSEDWWLDKFRG